MRTLSALFALALVSGASAQSAPPLQKRGVQAGQPEKKSASHTS